MEFIFNFQVSIPFSQPVPTKTIPRFADLLTGPPELLEIPLSLLSKKGLGEKKLKVLFT